MSRTIIKGGIALSGAVAALILAQSGVAQARTDAETKAIVVKFNDASFVKRNLAATKALTAPEFIDHDGPVDYAAFMKMIGGGNGGPPGGAPGGAPGGGAPGGGAPGGAPGGPPGGGAPGGGAPGGGANAGPPPPNLILAHGDYVLFMTEQNTPDPNVSGKTYIADDFDLFRVNADGKVAEHWDNFTKSATPGGPPGGGLPVVKDDANAGDEANNESPATHSRTDAQTIAIVNKFNADAFMPTGDKQAMAAEMSEDFYEHHPPSGTPEATKSEFLAHFGPDAPKRSGPPAGAPNGGAGAGPSGGPPAPFLTLPFGDYVLVVTKQTLPDPTAAGKTYEAESFDLFRVNNRDQVAEHWDNGTIRAKKPTS